MYITHYRLIVDLLQALGSGKFFGLVCEWTNPLLIWSTNAVSNPQMISFTSQFQAASSLRFDADEDQVYRH